MDDKYYTPDIQDIHVGYQCETTNNTKEWFPWKFEYYNFTALDLELLNSMYRTPYLNREQIVNEGWKFGWNNWQANSYSHNLWVLTEFTNRAQGIMIHYANNQIFRGSCPSINEFRTICRLLNINYDIK